MILDDIKLANINALKKGDASARLLFSVFLNKIKLLEISKRGTGENLTEAEVIAALQKMLKELEEEKENYQKVNNLNQVDVLCSHIKILNGFLPQMMSKEEIYEIINKLEDKSIGSVMKLFKTDYAGKCDMRQVNEVIKMFN